MDLWLTTNFLRYLGLEQVKSRKSLYSEIYIDKASNDRTPCAQPCMLASAQRKLTNDTKRRRAEEHVCLRRAESRGIALFVARRSMADELSLLLCGGGESTKLNGEVGTQETWCMTRRASSHSHTRRMAAASGPPFRFKFSSMIATFVIILLMVSCCSCPATIGWLWRFRKLRPRCKC